MSNETPTVGERAYRILRQATDLRWFDTGRRLTLWRQTIIDAYQARAEGTPDAQVTLPQGVYIQGRPVSQDAADAVLNAFDSWLGRGIVDDAYEAALDDEPVDVGFAEVDAGTALAIALGW